MLVQREAGSRRTANPNSNLGLSRPRDGHSTYGSGAELFDLDTSGH
jgi:hypothetical protein